MKSQLSKIKIGKNADKERINQFNQGIWKCNVCKKLLPFNKFTKVEKHWSGISYICKNCSTKRRNTWKNDNYWQNRAHDINRRANKNYVTGNDLEKIWDISKHKCYYCGVKLNIKEKGLVHIEHVINGVNKVSNLVISCHRCNGLKRDATVEELENIAQKIKKHEVAFV